MKATHVIDWGLVKSLEDVKEILKGLEMKVDITQCNKRLLKYLVKIEETNEVKNKFVN